MKVTVLFITFYLSQNKHFNDFSGNKVHDAIIFSITAVTVPWEPGARLCGVSMCPHACVGHSVEGGVNWHVYIVLRWECECVVVCLCVLALG